MFGQTLVDWSDPADVTNVILLATAVIYGLVLLASRRGTKGEALLDVIDRMQSDQARSDRRAIYRAPTDFNLWTRQQKEAAERICQLYGTVGMVFRARVVHRRAILRNSGHTIRRAYDCAQPFVEERARRYYEDGWPNFTYLQKKVTWYWRRRLPLGLTDLEDHETWYQNRLTIEPIVPPSSSADRRPPIGARQWIE
jgi:hypothetical protein